MRLQFEITGKDAPHTTHFIKACSNYFEFKDTALARKIGYRITVFLPVEVCCF